MNSAILIQTLVNLVLFAGIAFLWVKLHRPQKDDPRLSRGLQLLQSKIAVLEDLSQQIENQFHQLNQLMEIRAKDVQTTLENCDKKMAEIDQALKKSLKAAYIFQDKIPHEEVKERQNTVKYVKAARMAHAGKTTEEIGRAVDLSHAEINLIVKLNRDQLQFDDKNLPDWVEAGLEETQTPSGRTPHPPPSVAISRAATPSRAAESRGDLPPATAHLKTSEPSPRSSTTSGVEVQTVVFPNLGTQSRKS